MALNLIDEILADLRQGKMVILMDDEDRENEGDIIVPAECVTPDIINFMAVHARGLICLTLTPERCQQLNLPLMVNQNGTVYSTNFTLSIEAAEGVTTGISAADRALTVKRAVMANALPEDIVQPGHVFPLMAKPGGVLSRAGHTEAGCDLARMAGYEAASVIVEVINDDGTMARRSDLEKFAEKHGIKIGTIADLIHYRTLNETTVVRESEQVVSTEAGDFNLITYRDTVQNLSHLAFVKGEPSDAEPTLVRVHVADPARDFANIVREGCPPSWTMSSALQYIAKQGEGVVVLVDVSEKQTDLAMNFTSALTPQTVKSADKSGSGTYLTVGTGSQILRDLGIRKMRLLSSPKKFSLTGFDLEAVEFIPYSSYIGSDGLSDSNET
ncbi:bifunctional 3,4-dihydroxy-2-butanone-4-phosphate synthase/GTP cyclohydrolase II [Marinomonas mediterranea]|uniref:3,4-dihydroxy-2-butanone 4-phosphate synthase n=1 Tax=Marinomonas mediterranea (strain ATCC 700492 / JCM 21426 / NBRC 103028 / MMB-1) TaxID=717774 RepID=F2JZL2_MARM1|nr:bifunctional 3,4-dihydroxy-2-butanone-4-phosphate synthase/GTP cyclohydrolase II [Marinomonas mediterranea]ADZ89795.1 3,4-dihydroxy-2-butanone 4-phosphate synthase [Marinomonas mediterranea MMB-1]WCN07884.1 bifunctional 3,4-dihydroxy-2-butanone-4-phosphate synthase/GTP cyclohydrolase II [Marinomonas mediterranea]WCN11979.1 bifunctional 3,4-dihydroxy-2-butanone-4-phosphate synthase/GTP cyclohydrolase II [Marinomonas mediterranea]WCN16016.1 bifunctional 3,4-dihydroxy-2-butanone-4-phosphate syn